MQNNTSGAVAPASKNLWQKIFSEPPEQPVTQKKAEIKKNYDFWRKAIFWMSFIIYIVAYIGRKNFSIAMPIMNKQFGITDGDKGLILAIASIVYGTGKFVNGAIADRSNVRVGLPFNLVLAGTANLALAFAPWVYKNFLNDRTSIIIYMCLFWGISQWFQSALFPYCAKSLIRWFPNATRAVNWARWSTSHEIGSFIAMNTAAYVATAFGSWGFEAIFFVPFALSIIAGVIGFFSLRDRPASLGLPDVEEICGTKMAVLTESEQKEQDADAKLGYFELLKKYVLKSKVMWNLAAIYFCVYIFRNGPVNWIFDILASDANKASKANSLEALKNTDPSMAFKASTLCLVGMVGTYFAPVISEKIFKGRRAPANFWCLFIGAFTVIGMWFASSQFSPLVGAGWLKDVVTYVSLGIAGFTVCVPQVLVGGLCAVESASKRVASAASGFAGLLGYYGSALGDFLNGLLKDISKTQYQDSRLLLIYWGVTALVGALLCIPLWNAKANKEYSH